jgi:hypothetical protein
MSSGWLVILCCDECGYSEYEWESLPPGEDWECGGCGKMRAWPKEGPPQLEDP